MDDEGYYQLSLLLSVKDLGDVDGNVRALSPSVYCPR
jgi:hypothetical protein